MTTSQELKLYSFTIVTCEGKDIIFETRRSTPSEAAQALLKYTTKFNVAEVKINHRPKPTKPLTFDIRPEPKQPRFYVPLGSVEIPERVMLIDKEKGTIKFTSKKYTLSGVKELLRKAMEE
jgi:hypothetical protein